MRAGTRLGNAGVVVHSLIRSSLHTVRAAAGPIAGNLLGVRSRGPGGSTARRRFSSARRALLLQLAHPGLLLLFGPFSKPFADLVGRFHRTFNITFTMVFGTLDQALAASRGCIGATPR